MSDKTRLNRRRLEALNFISKKKMDCTDVQLLHS